MTRVDKEGLKLFSILQSLMVLLLKVDRLLVLKHFHVRMTIRFRVPPAIVGPVVSFEEKPRLLRSALRCKFLRIALALVDLLGNELLGLDLGVLQGDLQLLVADR